MRRVILTALACMILLSACSLFGDSTEIEAPTGDAMPTPSSEAVPAVTVSPPVPSGDGKFSLRYSASATLNPITGTDAANMAPSTLMYEGLFVVHEDLSYGYVLCESFDTEDFITWDFTLRNDVLMSDGTELSVYDIIYSLNQARQSRRYKTRLSCIESVSAAGARTVRVKLNAAEAKLPLLLDVPVIKDGASGTAPRGCGAYKYSNEGGVAALLANEYYRHAETLPVDIIYLVECADSELGEYFTESKIDLFSDDPNAPAASVRRDHEIRYYKTTVLQYIGFNPRTSAIADARFRSVVQIAVDRTQIVSDILGTRAAAAPLVLPPYYRLYDATWEPEVRTDTLVAMSQILGEIGLADSNSDTFLEYPSENGYIPFSLTFLVNEENEPRVRAARLISDTLRRVGINVILRELPFDEFTDALEKGAFDMYYGETRLSSNLDLSELLSPGGALNYGGMGSQEYDGLISRLRAARSEFSERGAARDLCTAASAGLPIIPVAYKQYAVHSGRNEIRGITPSQTGLFWNIYEWTIDVK